MRASPRPAAIRRVIDKLDRMAEVVWVVRRQDDHGNRFEVSRHDTREAAQEHADVLEARGHKQLYWVAPLES